MHTSRPQESAETSVSSEGIECSTFVWCTSERRIYTVLWAWVEAFFFFSLIPFDKSWCEGRWSHTITRKGKYKCESERESREYKWVLGRIILGWWPLYWPWSLRGSLSTFVWFVVIYILRIRNSIEVDIMIEQTIQSRISLLLQIQNIELNQWNRIMKLECNCI